MTNAHCITIVQRCAHLALYKKFAPDKRLTLILTLQKKKRYASSGNRTPAFTLEG